MFFITIVTGPDAKSTDVLWESFKILQTSCFILQVKCTLIPMIEVCQSLVLLIFLRITNRQEIPVTETFIRFLTARVAETQVLRQIILNQGVKKEGGRLADQI